jgi:hypothetical protein
MVVGDKSFESVEQFKYLWITQTNQNCTHEEVKSRLNSVSGYYHNNDYFPVRHYLTGSYKWDRVWWLHGRTGSLN